MNIQKPIARNYQPGTCYLCQLYLTCNKSLAFDTCKCDATEKPKNKQKKRECYSRIYNSKDNGKLIQLQIDKLKECDKYFGYCSNFDGYFHFSLCTKCHNIFARLKRNNTKKKQTFELNLDPYDSTTTTLPASSHSTSPILISPLSTSPPSSPTHAEDSTYSSSDYDCDITEFNFNFIIRPCNEKARPAKWESFKVFTFIEFEDEILELVQNQFDTFIKKDNYIIIYKSSIHGMEIKEKRNKRLKSDVDLEISQLSDQRKVSKSSSNIVPKESNIDEESSKKAAIIMELTKKWFCQEYSRTCFIDTTRHIQLTPHHLTSWANAIERGFASVDDPPAVPLFNSTKKKEIPLTQYNPQISQNSQFSPFINPLLYQHLFNQFMQTNSYFLPSSSSENSHFLSNSNLTQMQNFTNTKIAQENYANGNTNTNMNTNFLHEGNAGTNTNTNTNIIQDNSVNTQLQKITIEQFLEDLDKEYGANTFTKYLDAFKEQEVDVLDIINFKDNDWITLGIEKVGPKSKIIRALDKYNK
ncbi:hypothetical protein GLOIN_2v1772564 [Rhizophagus irregularis DAOM 181602=DAOM 197198]|nr:hypothetical protein GLOIN_2v1772564 [Rhizophagus irregularis DAOM 181602=DAOM 197198]